MSVELFIPVAEKVRDPYIQLILTSFSKVSSVFRAVNSRVSSALSPAKLARSVQQLKCENEKRFAQDVRSSFNFEFALNGPAKKIHNKKQLLFQPERKKM